MTAERVAETVVMRKGISSAFVLDKAKLTRILDIMEQRFNEANTPYNPTFDVTLSKGKRITLPSTEQLFALDNSVKNHIETLVISAPGSETKELSCNLHFQERRYHSISLEVEAKTTKRASQCFAELEEQIERTLSSNWPDKLSSGNLVQLLMAVMTIAITVYFSFTIATTSTSKNTSIPRNELTNDELIYFDKKAKEIRSTDDKINFLFELQGKQLERNLEHSIALQNLQTPEPVIKWKSFINLKILFLAIPVILITGCIIYLAKCCYPYAVFQWGDFGDHYKKILSIRKNIWTVVIAALLIGLVGEMFALSLAPYFS